MKIGIELLRHIAWCEFCLQIAEMRQSKEADNPSEVGERLSGVWTKHLEYAEEFYRD